MKFNKLFNDAKIKRLDEISKRFVNYFFVARAGLEPDTVQDGIDNHFWIWEPSRITPIWP
jgi:hypothetical protein